MLLASRHFVLYLFFLIALTSCGGGNGSSPSASSSSTSSIINEKPNFSVSFPQQNADIRKSLITIRGVASDDKAIKYVAVNNHSATLKSVDAITGANTQDFKYVQWEATIPLAYGNNSISIKVSDSDGAVSSNAESPLILLNSNPTEISFIDPFNKQLFADRGGDGNFFSYNLKSMQGTTSNLASVPYNSCHVASPDGQKVYSFNDTNDGNTEQIKLFSRSYSSGQWAVASNYQIPWNQDEYLWSYIEGCAYLSAYNSLYVNILLVRKDSQNRDNYLIKYDLKKNLFSTVYTYTTKKQNTPNIQVIKSMRGAGSSLVALTEDAALVQIDPATGNQSNFSVIPFNSAIAVDNSGQYLYAANEKTYEKINIYTKESNTYELDNNDPIVIIGQQYTAYVDEPNNGLILFVPGFAHSIFLDFATGKRSYLFNKSMGSGIKITKPSAMTLSEDKKSIYVLDDKFSYGLILYKIDITTGNRETIADLIDYKNQNATSLVSDYDNNRLFFAASNTIYEIDLNTRSIKKIYPSDHSNNLLDPEPLTSITGITYDGNNNRLIAATSNEDKLFSFDLSTLNKTTLATLNNPDSANIISGAADIILDKTTNQIYTAQYGSGDVYVFDLASEKNKLLFNTCIAINSNETISPTYITKIKLDNDKRILYVVSQNWLLKYSLNQNTCSAIPVSTLDVVTLADGRIIASNLFGIMELDQVYGERAYIAE